MAIATDEFGSNGNGSSVGNVGNTKSTPSELTSSNRSQPRDVEAASADEPSVIERLSSQAKDAVNELLATQQQRGVEKIGALADVLRRQSETIEDSPLSPIIGRAADQIGRAQELLAEANLDDAVDGTRQFARREPLWFLGGALLVGAACARFLKASSTRVATPAVIDEDEIDARDLAEEGA